MRSPESVAATVRHHFAVMDDMAEQKRRFVLALLVCAVPWAYA